MASSADNNNKEVFYVPLVTKDARKHIFTFDLDPAASRYWRLLFTTKLGQKIHSYYALIWIRVDEQGQPELHVFHSGHLPKCFEIKRFCKTLTICTRSLSNACFVAARYWPVDDHDFLRLEK